MGCVNKVIVPMRKLAMIFQKYLKAIDIYFLNFKKL